MKNEFVFKAYPSSLDTDEQTMIEFLKDFDPIVLKYSTDYTIDGNYPVDEIAKMSSFERNYQYGELTKQKYSAIEDNLSLVYGNKKLVHNDVLAYHLTEKKFIHEYLSIPQLDKMFDEDYFNFEWDLHAGQNFSEHRNDYNRDHFIHQIRNMYMMLVCLNEYNFFDATYKIFSERKSGKIAEYVVKKQKEFLNDKTAPYFNLFEGISSFIETLDRGKFKGKFLDADNGKCGLTIEEYAEYYFMKYVIYASTILAALFHDMGYPICYFLEMRHRVSEYNPTLYMFTHNSVDSFDQLEAKLNNSLLFTIVSPHELKKSLQIDAKKGKYNHGAYSAIAFLLQFYNTGMIHSLSSEKQCAIELAAVAIYNHTVKYNCISPDKNNNYYQPVFKQNPISFLLRFCDDVQEWDRRYFEISTDSDLSVCPKCLMPLLYEVKDSSKQLGEFKCFCNESLFRFNSFLKRKIYVVSIADSLKLKLENNNLYVSINYDYYKLLKMSRVNNTYAKYRLKELNELKLLLRNQNFHIQSEEQLDFNYICLDYFMTSNPITIKLKILERYLYKKYGSNYKNMLLKKNVDYIFNDLFEPKVIERMSKTEGLYPFLCNGGFDFYRKLLKLAIECRDDAENYTIQREVKNRNIKKRVNNFIKEYTPNSTNTSMYQLYERTIEILIKDCLAQYSKELVFTEEARDSFMENRDYYKQYAVEEGCDDLVYNCIEIYCNKENYFNKYYRKYDNGDKPYIGYYSDLHFFYAMNEKLKEV